jgi:hypothetical protein
VESGWWGREERVLVLAKQDRAGLCFALVIWRGSCKGTATLEGHHHKGDMLGPHTHMQASLV